MVWVNIYAEVHPTESEEKIRRAILSIFPDAVFRRRGKTLFAASRSVARLGEMLREQRIRDSARAQMFAGMRHSHVEIKLNKQAACAGRVSFSVEAEPLGPIEVVIVAEDIRSVVDAIAPDTRALRERRSRDRS
jgi:hypothetical protein